MLGSAGGCFGACVALKMQESWGPQEVRSMTIGRVQCQRGEAPALHPILRREGGLGKLVRGIGEGAGKVCQERLPSHEQGSMIFPSTVGVQAWRSAFSGWLLPRVLPVIETGAQEGLGGMDLS